MTREKKDGSVRHPYGYRRLATHVLRTRDKVSLSNVHPASWYWVIRLRDGHKDGFHYRVATNQAMVTVNVEDIQYIETKRTHEKTV